MNSEWNETVNDAWNYLYRSHS